MQIKELVIIGGGGHATVVAEAARLAGHQLAGFLDDEAHPDVADWSISAESQGLDIKGFTHLGRLGSLAAIAPSQAWIIAVGGLALRRKLIAQLSILQQDSRIGSPASIIHPSASVSPTANLGSGVFVGPMAVIHSRARIADHAILNTATVIEHDCQIGENSHIAPGSVLGGGVHVGPDALIGLGSRLLPTIRIGTGAVIGGGAVVVRDVAAGQTVVGVPAAPLRRDRGT